jgi:hypothetical protein
MRYKQVKTYTQFDVVLTVHRRYYVEIKCQLDATDEFLLRILGHTTPSSTPYRQLENEAPNMTGSNHLYNNLELLMMGIMVPRNMLSKQ